MFPILELRVDNNNNNKLYLMNTALLKAKDHRIYSTRLVYISLLG